MTETEQDFAQGWRPTKGDAVKGAVVDIAATDGGFGVYPIVTLKTEDGTEVAIHAFHTVLRKELARRRPSVGDELEITYLGKKEGGSFGNGYDAYRVRSDKDVAGYDWSQDLSPEEQAARVTATASPPIAPAPIPELFGANLSGAGPLPLEASAAARHRAGDGPLPPKPPAPQGEQFGDEPPF